MLFSTVGDRIKENMTAAAATPEFKQALQTALGDKTLMADKEAYGIVQGLANPKGGGGALNSVSEDSSVISRLPKAIAHPFEAGFADAMDHVFLTAMGISVLGFLVLLLGGLAIGWARSTMPQAPYSVVAILLYILVLRAFSSVTVVRR